MNITFSEEQEMWRTTARRFLARECPPTLVREIMKDERGYSPELWQRMADAGWLGLNIPETYGGTGGSFVNLTLLFEEMGRACLPSPFFSTVLAASLVVSEGTSEQKRELLPRIATGRMISTLALTEPGSRYDSDSIDTTASPDGPNGYIINGTKLFVSDANVADDIICVARNRNAASERDGLTLFLVDTRSQGVSCTLLNTLADRQCEVVFEAVKVPANNILGKLDRGWEQLEMALRAATVGKCAEMVGAAQQILEMTVSYAKERIQFDRRIGSFQAVQHHCANMAVDVDASRLITYQAAWKIQEGLPCVKEVAMAKAWVNEACRRVSALGHQVHGAIGFTWDHDLHLYTKRIKMAESIHGDADFHREQVAEELGL